MYAQENTRLVRLWSAPLRREHVSALVRWSSRGRRTKDLRETPFSQGVASVRKSEARRTRQSRPPLPPRGCVDCFRLLTAGAAHPFDRWPPEATRIIDVRWSLPIAGVKVRRKRRWTSAGETPATALQPAPDSCSAKPAIKCYLFSTATPGKNKKRNVACPSGSHVQSQQLRLSLPY